jgi:hypothetical protein
MRWSAFAAPNYAVTIADTYYNTTRSLRAYRADSARCTTPIRNERGPCWKTGYPRSGLRMKTRSYPASAARPVSSKPSEAYRRWFSTIV